MDNNLFWSKKGALPAKDFLRSWQEQGFGKGSAVYQYKKEDYRLKKGSPAYKLGIQPIDLEGVGPRD